VGVRLPRDGRRIFAEHAHLGHQRCLARFPSGCGIAQVLRRAAQAWPMRPAFRAVAPCRQGRRSLPHRAEAAPSAICARPPDERVWRPMPVAGARCVRGAIVP